MHGFFVLTPETPIGRCLHMTRRKLWEVDDGGATYWVSALDAQEALSLVRALEYMEEYDDYPLSAIELNRVEADQRTFMFEDGEKCKLSNVFDLLSAYSEIIACSEWP